MSPLVQTQSPGTQRTSRAEAVTLDYMSQSLKTIAGELWNRAWKDLDFRLAEGADSGCEPWRRAGYGRV